MNFLTQHTTFSPLLAQLDIRSFELQTRTGMTSAGPGAGGVSTLGVIAIVSFVLILFLMATLWPRGKENDINFRQRQFGRVDGLFFRIQGAFLDPEEAERYLSGQFVNPALLQGLMLMKGQSITMVSLSLGGCGFVSPTPLKKGALLLLQLASLPDFPQENLIIGCRVVWSKRNPGAHGTMESVGCKFVFPHGTQPPEDVLKRYITYLMDEPVG
ncbi:MAG: PilZ domain [Pseudomonadota bacterium]